MTKDDNTVKWTKLQYVEFHKEEPNMRYANHQLNEDLSPVNLMTKQLPITFKLNQRYSQEVATPSDKYKTSKNFARCSLSHCVIIISSSYLNVTKK